MFWNDPILYGATLPYRDMPYRDVGLQTPYAGSSILPWQTTPSYAQRFTPPGFGYTPFGYTPYAAHFTPYLQGQYLQNPWLQSQYLQMFPFAQQFAHFAQPYGAQTPPFHVPFWGPQRSMIF